MCFHSIADDTFKRFFQNENVWISIQISLKFVPKAPINNIPSLVQIMAWCRPGDKPLSEPMMVSLLTHICVTRPQWVNAKIIAKLMVLFNTMRLRQNGNNFPDKIHFQMYFLELNLFYFDSNFTETIICTTSWQLSCCDMCKIVTWVDNQEWNKSKMHFCEIWIMSS